MEGKKTRMRKEESFLKAIVILRRCGGFSFTTITKLLHQDSEVQKRNVMYYYERDKDRFPCEKDMQLVHLEEENIINQIQK